MTTKSSLPAMEQFVAWMRTGAGIAQQHGVQLNGDIWLSRGEGKGEAGVHADHLGLALIGKYGSVKDALLHFEAGDEADFGPEKFFGHEFGLPTNVIREISDDAASRLHLTETWSGVETMARDCEGGYYDRYV